MPTKRYSLGSESIAKSPSVKEAKAEPYGREKDQRRGARVASSLASVKKRIKRPVKRSKPEIAWALEIAGIGAGPADLSEKSREYLRRDR